MNRITIAVAILTAAITSTASADHFAAQRQAAAASRNQADYGRQSGHWGGPTTQHRWYGGNTTYRQFHYRVPSAPGVPYGGWPIPRCDHYYGIYSHPGYGFGSAFGGGYTYIHREIHIP